MRRILIVMALLGAIQSPLRAEVVQVDNQALKKLILEGVPIVDVRLKSEWLQTGVLPGSHLITFFDERGRYDVDAWLKQLSEIAGPDEPVVFVCAVGGRTATITRFLDKKVGYSGVHNLTRGIDYWISRGNPTVKADCAPERPIECSHTDETIR